MYDTSPSPLRAGTRSTLFGRGGILDAGGSILDDLVSGNILGAIRTGGSLRNTLKGSNISSLVASELVSGAISTGLNFISNNGSRSGSSFSIPSIGSSFGLNSLTSGIGNVTKGLFSSSNFGSLNSNLSGAMPDIGGITNMFGGVSSSINQLSQKFVHGTNLNSDFVGNFNTMASSMSNGMAVAENEMVDIESNVSPSFAPSITNLTDSIPSADSLKQITTNATPMLNNMSKSFAPIAQGISEQMKTLTNSGEMRQMSNTLKSSMNNVVSNGKNIGQ
jgi:hypothetical protein